MAWYWLHEGDALVIREGTLADDVDGEYIAEIDARYLKGVDLKAAKAVADRIVGAEGALAGLLKALRPLLPLFDSPSLDGWKDEIIRLEAAWTKAQEGR
jgi:hypothetical protein